MNGFEWDEDKNAANIVRHGIDFDDAIRIFDGSVLEKMDDRHGYGEVRMVAIGIAYGRELFVVYTWRGDNRRIISARRANRHERQAYYQTLGG